MISKGEWRWRAGLAGVVLAGIGIPVLTAYVTGTMKIPRLDDWAFERVAVTLYSTGHLRLIGWGEMTLVGHELWGLPFIALLGRSYEAVHWAGAVVAALALTGTFSLYRRFVSPRLALLGTAAVAALPTFAVLTTMYMTDLTGYAGEVLGLTVGVGALRADGRRRSALLVLSLALGFWAFTARESSIAAPTAVLVGHVLWSARNGRAVKPLLAAGIAYLGTAGVVYLWRKGLPHDQATPLSRPGLLGLGQSALVLVESYFTLALGAAPVLVASRWGDIRRIVRSDRGAVLAGALVLAAGAVLLIVPHYPAESRRSLLVGGTAFSEFGIGGRQQGSLGPARLSLFPDAVWLAINLVALCAGGILAGIGWDRLRGTLRAGGRWRSLGTSRPDVGVVAAYVLIDAGFLAFRAVERGFLIDRYFIGLTMACALLVLIARRDRISAGRGAIAVVAMALVSLVLVLDGESYDHARWAAAQRLEAAGATPEQISAGFEWLGAHHRGPIGSSENILGFPRRCVTVAQARVVVRGHELVAKRSYGPVRGILQRSIWLYRDPKRCNPSPVHGAR